MDQVGHPAILAEAAQVAGEPGISLYSVILQHDVVDYRIKFAGKVGRIVEPVQRPGY